MKKQHDRNAELVPEQPMPCPEPGCPGTLRRKWSPANRQWFYGCTRWADFGCHGAIGCHADGRPLGKPADQATRKSRREAHEAFDELWQEGWMSRSDAYAWVSKAMGIDEAHMAEMTKEQCARVVELCGDKLEALEQDERDDDELDDLQRNGER